MEPLNLISSGIEFIVYCVFVMLSNSLISTLYQQAPCEAESQCAALCKNDKVILTQWTALTSCFHPLLPFFYLVHSILQVYAVASEDMDSLTFGTPRFVRHLMDPSSKKIPVMEFEVAKVSSVVFGLKFILILYTLHQIYQCRFWRSLNSLWTNSLTCASSVDVTTVIALKVSLLTLFSFVGIVRISQIMQLVYT